MRFTVTTDRFQFNNAEEREELGKIGFKFKILEKWTMSTGDIVWEKCSDGDVTLDTLDDLKEFTKRFGPTTLYDDTLYIYDKH